MTPVFVQGARTPPAERLPDDMKDLAYRSGFEVSNLRWDSDVQEMVKRLGLSPSPSPAGGVMGLLVFFWIIGTLSGPPSAPPTSEAPVAVVSPTEARFTFPIDAP